MIAAHLCRGTRGVHKERAYRKPPDGAAKQWPRFETSNRGKVRWSYIRGTRQHNTTNTGYENDDVKPRGNGRATAAMTNENRNAEALFE